MSKKKTSKSVIANAIIWAGVILATALVMAGGEQSKMVGLLLIVGWYASHLNLTTSPGAMDRECAFFRRLFAGSKPTE
jgi:hypothetical protein